MRRTTNRWRYPAKPTPRSGRHRAGYVIGLTLMLVFMAVPLSGQAGAARTGSGVADADGPSTFCNSTLLSVPDRGSATPYPSSIPVTGLIGRITKVTATLMGVSHNAPFDLDIALSGPRPTTNVLLLSDSGGFTPVSAANLTFDDGAGAPVRSPMSSGTYRPTDDETGGPDVFGAPAPALSGATALSTFNGSGANGTWSLWVSDDALGDSGTISGGWCLTVTTSGDLGADPGGPYTLGEGATLRLAGSSSTPDATYDWDLNQDGDFGDATGTSPTIRWTRLEPWGIDNGPATHLVALRVTVGTHSETASTVLNVTNTAPKVQARRKLTAAVGTGLRLRLHAVDPSARDARRRFFYAVKWRARTRPHIVRGSAHRTLRHRYRSTGRFIVRVRATDQNGGRSKVRTIRVVITRRGR